MTYELLSQVLALSVLELEVIVDIKPNRGGHRSSFLEHKVHQL